ncbi:MarR family winged helix-turn-helix transcriptional regulator [Stappia sp. ES.058]|uniref:MarR family winged helix-turn-helix transcriptional regulator n=1 Tax=Stappia sp. ES.058 TaxID=1881061 RepID=UPI00087A1883|nr:MarR family winged helix-turn-helix transcriptional regulator [Stappia sp. ES.058]SDU15454.1 DNA-binding transcriptional regulator, MarR family [Stappia sp. ES.058]
MPDSAIASSLTPGEPSRAGGEQALADRFGALAVTMLNDTELVPSWSISFIANFFTGPIYRDVGERFGLSRPEFVILFSLLQKPGLVARDVSLATGLPKNSISRAVSDLLGKALIERETDVGDKRAKLLRLTRAGQEVISQVVPLFEVRQTAMRAVLSAPERATFDALLAKMIHAMPDWVGSD